MRYGDKSRSIAVLPTTDGPSAGGPPGNCRQHGVGLFSRLSSASVIRTTSLCATFVRPTRHAALALAAPEFLCGACLNICTGCCGTLIGIPAAIMQGILAPPPPRFLPAATCGPPMCPPPTCGPPPCSPQPITKCKPASYGSGPMPYGYAPAAAGFAPNMMPPRHSPLLHFTWGLLLRIVGCRIW